MSDYYTISGNPATGAGGASADMRSEFALISAGFDLLPDLTTVANRIPHVNSGSTAIVTTSGFSFDGTTVTAPALTSPGAIATTATTDATSISTGASKNSGGASITKALWVGGLVNVAGAVTLQDTLTYGGVTLTNAVTGTGKMVLDTAPTFASTIKVTTGASVGGATPGAGGLAFPATQVAVADANTLDDYEEGTWTPTDGSGAGLSLTSPAGSYEKIGRMFRAGCTLSYPVTADGSAATIGGLPFTVSNNEYARQGFRSTTTESTFVEVYPAANGTTFALLTAAAAGITNATMSTDGLNVTVVSHI